MVEIAFPGQAPTTFSVALVVRIDLAREAELDELVRRYLAGEAVDVVLDLGAVTFMDSSGLGFVARLYREAKDRGGTLPSPTRRPRWTG